MRILHACKYFYPRITGVTAYVENLGLRQAAAGHEVAVASWGEPGGSHEHRGLLTLRAKAWDGEALVRLITDFDPDVVHAHSIWETTRLAGEAARQLARPYVITTHGTWNFLRYTGAYNRLLDRFRLGVWLKRILWPRLLRGAGAVIVLNAQEEADALKAGVNPNRIHRIPNAVDPDLFRPGERDAARREWGWPEARTVLFVGAMQAQKGLFTALRAARMLRDTEVRWVFCGEGPDLERARAVAEAEGLARRVAFTGRVDRARMPSLYQAADVVVLPSRHEPFATVFLEAMACGLPCIGSADGGTPEIIVDTQTGFLVPPGDSHALAEMTDWLVRHPREAQALGGAGRERVEREFAWPRVASRIEDAYRSALALVVLLAVLAVCQPALAASVAALDILTMLDPRTGRDLSGAAGDWRAANPVWDGGTVRLSAARGETAAFQAVILAEPGETLEDIRIQADLGGVPCRTYRAWHIWGVPEVAVPLGAGGSSFDIPSRMAAEAEATRGYRVWSCVVEVEVPRSRPPGLTRGTLSVTWKGGGASLPLELRVAPFALPVRPAFVLEMNSYGDFLRLLPASLDTYLDLHRLFRRFRCTFTLVPYRQDGTAILDFLTPALDKDGRPDFTAFDKALAGLFDGSTFPDGQPVSHFLLPLRADWPAPFRSDASHYEAENAAVRKALAEHIQAKGWSSTRFEEFHNENPENGARVPWRLDEPASAKDLAGHELFLGFRDRGCAGDPGACPVRYRIDISRWQPLRADLQRMAGRVTDWSISADPGFLTPEALRFFRALGGQWFLAYGELDGFQTNGKTTPWAVYPARLANYRAMGMDGFAQWQVDRWGQKDLPGIPREASPLFQSNAAGARDFIWPGAALGQAGAVPSLRLFALREGLNLLDYAALAERLRPGLAGELRERLRALDSARAVHALKARLSAILAEGRGDEGRD